ncbi:ion channel [Actibacterium ureilyticum]|uniref:ion channel n=1 Tax=Actibacterium ureilyticum TaxID=1590614 RepID=UPI000BAAC99D|nr:ion channel [Actibacterium ureilyticum]
MLHQIFLGTIVILITVLTGAGGFWVMESFVTRIEPWTVRRPHTPKLTLLLMITVVAILGIMTLAVWTWAIAFLMLGVFNDIEHATYFSIVAFTTLGYGDIILPLEWRILGGMTAANGLMNMGLYTGMLVEVLRRVRSDQVRGGGDTG